MSNKYILQQLDCLQWRWCGSELSLHVVTRTRRWTGGFSCDYKYLLVGMEAAGDFKHPEKPVSEGHGNSVQGQFSTLEEDPIERNFARAWHSRT
jgi:hypothetical protein